MGYPDASGCSLTSRVKPRVFAKMSRIPPPIFGHLSGRMGNFVMDVEPSFFESQSLTSDQRLMTNLY